MQHYVTPDLCDAYPDVAVVEPMFSNLKNVPQLFKFFFYRRPFFYKARDRVRDMDQI